MLLDAFHGDVDACTTVAVVLMPTVPTFESLLVAVRSLGVPANRTPLTRLVRVNPSSRDALERRLVRRVVLRGVGSWWVGARGVHLPVVRDDDQTLRYRKFALGSRLLTVKAAAESRRGTAPR